MINGVEMTGNEIKIETQRIVESETTEQTGETTTRKVGSGRRHALFASSHIISPVKKNWVRISGGWLEERQSMGGSSIVDKNYCKFKKIGGYKITREWIFFGDHKVL